MSEKFGVLDNKVDFIKQSLVILVGKDSKWAFGQLKLDDTSVIYVLGSHGTCVIFRYPIYSCYY